MPSDQAFPAARVNSPLSSLAGLLGSLVVLLIIIYVVFSGAQRQDSSRPVASSAPAAVVGHRAPAAVVDNSGAAVQPGEAARAIIAGIREKGQPSTIDLEHVYLEASEFRVAHRLADAHLLYFFAAREGHVPSAVVLGEMFDPLLFSPETSLMDEPYPLQAARWYSVAAQKGSPEAATRLADLRTWAELRTWAGARGREGDEAALRVLLSLP